MKLNKVVVVVLCLLALAAMDASALTVTTSDIQNGAVTDIKITGPISASKIERPAKVIIVAASGGHFTDPVAALNSITDASAANRYLVKIMPGVYTLPAGSMISLKDFVDIEGSGREVTRITKTEAGGNPTVGQEYVPSQCEMRNLTIEKISAGPAGYFDTVAVGLGWGTPKFTDVNIIAHGGTSAIGVYVTNSAPTFRNVSITAQGVSGQSDYAQGVLLSGAGSGNGADGLPYTFDNVSITASGAVNNYGFSSAGIDCTVVIRNSSIYGATWGLEASSSYQFNSNIKINNSSIKGDAAAINLYQGHSLSAAGTQIDGPIISSGTLKLVNCHDGGFNPILNQ